MGLGTGRGVTTRDAKTMASRRPLPMAPDLHGDRYGDLYGDIEPSPKSDWRGYFAGLAVVAMGTLAAGFLSDHYGVPLTLMALPIGLALAAAWFPIG